MPTDSRRARSGRVRARLAVAVEALQARLWPIPAIAVVLAVAVGLVMARVDVAVDPALPTGVRTFVFDGDADTARSVLSSIIGALVTATSLTFSLTVVAFQLASSQASPRLLRTFARDGVVHATLAVFLGTFAYALTVLRAVRDTSPSRIDELFVPRLSISLAFVLALASVITLVVFLAHLAAQLRVETMLKEVHEDALEAMSVVAGELESEAASDVPIDPPPGRRAVPAPRSGFVSGVDRGKLLRLARQHDVRVVELHAVGAHVIEGLPLLTVDPARDDSLDRALASAYTVGYERTAGQDYLFGVQQMVDIAAKALSPGVNDPTTAVHAIGHLSSLLVALRGLPASPVSIADEDGTPRLAPVRADFADALRSAVTQPRRYGAGDIDAATQLFALLREVSTGSDDPRVRGAVRAELDLLVADVAAADYLPPERARFQALADSVRDHLT